DGARSLLSPCTSEVNQRWTLEDAEDGQHVLRSQSSGKCSNVLPNATADGDPVLQYRCNYAPNQQ
ncbi:unnamed protein product, partial [Laminaria digitata]